MTRLSLARFRELVRAYGSRLERFPEREREAARALVESSAEARTLLDAESELDAHFSGVPLPEMSASLERRLLEIPLRAPKERRWPFATRWIPALSWAVAAVVGVWLGTKLPEDDPGTGAGGVTADNVPAGDAEPASEEAVLAMAAGAFADLEVTP